eukprot:jgi/Botrbrau1/8162/Bobra.357_2s0008.1
MTLFRNLVVLALHTCSIMLFSSGYMNSRVSLSNIAVRRCPPWDALAGSRRPPDKLAIIVIDGLRSDFVIRSERFSRIHNIPVMETLQTAASMMDGAAVLANLQAEAPTTTAQALKTFLTGSPPLFVDIGKSLSASVLVEDNLMWQLQAAGKKMVFMGDDTWTKLLPHTFTKAKAMASLNIQESDTVDEAIWQDLPAALSGEGEPWDVLVAHFLGIDHVGHTFDCGSPQMAAKVSQLDHRMEHVINLLLNRGGPGDLHENTLLLIMGDHGLTWGGDHGGGSIEEVETALFALHVGRGNASLPLPSRQGATWDRSRPPWAPQQQSCSIKHEQGPPEVRQLDLAATIAVMMGIAIPFSNIGQVSIPLWSLTGNTGPGPAFAENAKQVATYLEAYMRTGAPLPRSAVQKMATDVCSGLQISQNASQCMLKHQRYLKAAEDLARKQWTTYSLLHMVAGLLLYAGALLYQLYCTIDNLWHSAQSLAPCPAPGPPAMPRPVSHPGSKQGPSSRHEQIPAADVVFQCTDALLPAPRLSALSLASETVADANICADKGHVDPHVAEGRPGAAARLALEDPRTPGAAVIQPSAPFTPYAAPQLHFKAEFCPYSERVKADRLGAAASQPSSEIAGNQQASVPSQASQVQGMAWYSDDDDVACLRPSRMIAPGGSSLQGDSSCSLQAVLTTTGTVPQNESLGGKPRRSQPDSDATPSENPVRLPGVQCSSFWGSARQGSPGLPVGVPWCVADGGLRFTCCTLGRADEMFGVALALCHAGALMSDNCIMAEALVLACFLCVLAGRAALQGGRRRLPYAYAAGPTSPLVVLLAICHVGCISAMLEAASQGQEDTGGPLEVASSDILRGVVWEIVSHHAFFATGHFCEFSGLQFKAGFAGLADFNWWLSGGLLALNTFGTHVICAAFLPHRQHSVPARVHHLAYPLAASSRVTPPNFQAEGSGPSPQPPNTSSAGKLASTSIARHVWTFPGKSVEHGQERWPEGAYAGPDGLGNGPGVDNPNLRGGTAATSGDSTVNPATGRHLGAMKPSETFPPAIGAACPMPHGMSAHKNGRTARERHVHESSDAKTSTCNDEAACAQPRLELCGHGMQTGREMPGSTTHVFERPAEAFATPNQLSRQCKQKRSSVQPASHMPGLADTQHGGLGDESQRKPVSHPRWHESSKFHVMLSGPVPGSNDERTVATRADGGCLRLTDTRVSRDTVAGVLGFARGLVGGAAMLSACLQRHHAHAATLFATKFAFEAGMTVAVDVGLLLGDALL